ncbi:Gfo/Idh/MocA family protein [Granulosicoccus antarcticus]|uniref:Glucose--fructose oxidoreductase n=1 Tax=Granulosicoccus antarcticus IMCC3135 TaxID=1192854 RepID=A0A2Z2NJG4_9GAMM|nr:Gfo/Idh/MocA family oxidoreductase [Granulosicoccus antarcticus]ASJ71243.1 Glucose--fructose oxidoreductase [Granulosicoccus antarcticus IMCC3135]
MTQLTETPRVGVALIGAGMIAPTHVAALSAARTRVRLETIVSRRPERAHYLAELYAGPPPLFTSELSAVTQNPDVQIVIVATPPSVRIELIETLAKAGKHILLEKPVARTVDEARQVVQICEREGVTLGVLFQHRMRASSKAAAKLLASGALGKQGLIEIAVPLWREQSYYDELERGTYARDGGGVLITQAIHTIDLALSLTGPVSRVQAMSATTPLHQMEAEDFAVAGLHFSSGAVGSLVASTATFPHGRETITLNCEHGTLRLGADTLDISWRDGRCEQATPGTEHAGEDGPVIVKYEWHQAVIEDFIEAVQQGRAPMVTGREALDSHRLIEAIEQSSSGGIALDISNLTENN